MAFTVSLPPLVNTHIGTLGTPTNNISLVIFFKILMFPEMIPYISSEKTTDLDLIVSQKADNCMHLIITFLMSQSHHLGCQMSMSIPFYKCV